MTEEICKCGHRKACHTSHEEIEGKCNILDCSCKKFIAQNHTRQGANKKERMVSSPPAEKSLSEKRTDIIDKMCNEYPDIVIKVFYRVLELVKEQDKEAVKRLKEEISLNIILEPPWKYEELRIMIDKIMGDNLI